MRIANVHSRGLAWLFVGVCLVAGNVQAQEDARLQLAERIVKASGAEKLLEQFASLFFQSIVTPLQARQPRMASCPAVGKVLDTMQQDAGRLMVKAAQDSDYLGQMAKIYAETFTGPELQEMAAFLESPTGQKMVAKQPELMQKGAQIGQAMMAGQQDALKAFSSKLDTSITEAMETCEAGP